MNLGEEVSYIRYNKDGVSEGVAHLKGIGLDGEGRAIVLLKAGEDSFNTFLACVSPTPEFCEEFRARIAEIDALTKEGNEKAKAIVDEYNLRVDTIYDKLVGTPIEL